MWADPDMLSVWWPRHNWVATQDSPVLERLRRARTGETQAQVTRSAHARIFTHMAAAQQWQDTIREDIYYAGRREESINFTYMYRFWLENCWTCFERARLRKANCWQFYQKNQWMQEKTGWDKWQVNNPGWERWEIVFSQSQALFQINNFNKIRLKIWKLNYFIQNKQARYWNSFSSLSIYAPKIYNKDESQACLVTFFQTISGREIVLTKCLWLLSSLIIPFSYSTYDLLTWKWSW